MMMPGIVRERNNCELAFGVLKALMVSYSLWGSYSGLEPSDLSCTLQASPPELASVLDYLAGEGLVSIDPNSGRVRLTDRGADDLLC